MKNHILALRSISSHFALRLIQPFLWWVLGVFAIIVLITTVLATAYSGWWWLLLIPFGVVALILTGLWLLVHTVARRIAPTLTHEQKLLAKGLVEKLQRVAENVRMPYPLIIIRVAADLLRGKDQGFVQEVLADSKELRPDFEKLSQSFQKPI